ncbi:hypothetical protein DQQ10_21825 [Pseudochryseolinea flava]|uniref:Tail specific protease domain-containing protein n=1 Tax=Pseudochryseolinea flava TaxID=2059302 RepID=A0A364XX31_9BACT|nr:hypothetical protein DQQ10_21825 [Pseudochryseolinea flava]
MYCVHAGCQTTEEVFLLKDKAVGDLRLLQSSLYEIHPSVFRYTSKGTFDDHFQKACEAIGDSISELAFARDVASLIAMVRCGHTFAMFPQNREIRHVIPLEFRIINDRIYVINSGAQQHIPAGAEVVHINGTTSLSLLQQLRAVEVSDGFVTTTKDRRIERFFKWYYAAYIGQPNQFIVQYRHSGNLATTTVNGVSGKDLGTNQSVVERKPYSFTIDTTKSVGVLRIESFLAKHVKKRHHQNLKRTVKHSFRALDELKVDNLVIDLRGNTGGMTFVPPFLYSFLTDQDFKFKNKLVFKHGYRFSRPETLNRSRFSDWVNRQLMKEVNDTTFEWTLHNNTKTRYKAQRKPFQGKVFVLVDGITSSGAAEFATLVHHFKRGTLIGEESGGDYNGVTAYDRTYLQLPNSKVGVLIAGYRSIMAWNEIQYHGHGVPVDYAIAPTIEDVLLGKDLELEIVYNLIERK